MNNNKTSNSGVSLLGVVQIVFIILKLAGLISWSWWIVLVPLWVSLFLLLIAVLVLLIVYIAAK